jgi:hypothetical protein
MFVRALSQADQVGARGHRVAHVRHPRAHRERCSIVVSSSGRGEAWRDAKNAMTPTIVASMAAMLGCAAGQDHALAPFAIIEFKRRWHLAAITTPCPTLGLLEIAGWEPNGDVILIDPLTGAMRLMDDAGAWFVGEGDHWHQQPLRIFSNGLTFARAWARCRADWIEQLHADIEAGVVTRSSRVTEPVDGLIPGVALCGELVNVFNFCTLRGHRQLIVDDPRMVRCLSNALLRAARLPAVTAASALLRAVG